MPVHIKQGEFILRKPSKGHGKAIHALISRCPPLDPNSTYCYHLLCHHFADSCVVMEQQGAIKGFLSAYFRPDSNTTLFIWQVAIDASLRGQGNALLMLLSLLARPELKQPNSIETSIGPSNHASQALFRRLAKKLGAPMGEREFLTAKDFPHHEHHEQERLFHIGPLS